MLLTEKKIFVLCFLMFLISLKGTAQQIKFEEYDLANGLHIILHQENSIPLTAINVVYHVGSKDEPEGKKGFSHFFEHLMFYNSPRIPEGKKYATIIENLGGYSNASTSNDLTVYQQTVPSNYLETVLYLEADRMLQATIDAKGVETEKEIVKEEKRLRIDNKPYISFQENLFKEIFKNTYYSWLPIGTFEDIDSSDEEDFKKFFKKYYIPNNATLVIAGDIDVAQTKQWIEKYFSKISKGEAIEKLKKINLTPTNELKKTVEDNIQLPAVFMGYGIPLQISSPEVNMLHFAFTVLTMNQTNRLNGAAIYNKKIATQVASFLTPMENASMGLVLGILGQDKEIDDLEKVLFEEIEKLKTEPISEEELETMKTSFEIGKIEAMSTLSGIASVLGSSYALYGNTHLPNKQQALVNKITSEDVLNVCKKYLTKKNLVTLHYVPKK